MNSSYKKITALILAVLTLFSVTACSSSSSGSKNAKDEAPEIEMLESYATPFEDLPEVYSAEDALADGCALTGSEFSADALTAFAKNTRDGKGSSVRIAEYDGDKLALLSEITWNGEYYLLKTRADGSISEHKYPYMFADDNAIYISDCISAANCKNFSPEIAKIPVITSEHGDISAAQEAFKALTKVLLSASPVIVYKCYSPDGERFVCCDLEHSLIAKINDTLKYTVSTPKEVKELANDDSDQIADQIMRVEWLDNVRFIMTFSTFYDIMYFETRNTDTFEVERHSYSDEYTVTDGEVSYIG